VCDREHGVGRANKGQVMVSLLDAPLSVDPEALVGCLRRVRSPGRTCVSLVSVAISVSDGSQSTVVTWVNE